MVHQRWCSFTNTPYINDGVVLRTLHTDTFGIIAKSEFLASHRFLTAVACKAISMIMVVIVDDVPFLTFNGFLTTSTCFSVIRQKAVMTNTLVFHSAEGFACQRFTTFSTYKAITVVRIVIVCNRSCLDNFSTLETDLI